MSEDRERTAPRILQRLGAAQAHRPWLLLLVAALTLLPSGLFASRLGFKPDFSELLPDNKDSVIEMRRVSKRLPGVTTLAVTAEIADAQNSAALKAFVDALAPRLEALGPDQVAQVDRGVHESRRFFEQNKLLYADLKDLQSARDELVERYEYEVQKQLGTLLDEGDAPPPITAESIRQRLQKKAAGAQAAAPAPGAAGTGKPAPDPFPDGYYMSPDRKFITVLVRTSLSGGAARQELRRKVEAAVAEVGPTRLDPTMKVGYTGDLVVSAEEYDAIIRDLSEVGAGGVIGVLASVLLFFLRVRTVLVMGASLAIGLLWTFGLTFFTIGYLNSSTGFLVSIIAGNGINYGLIYMARYIEARRDDELPVDQAIAVAHRDTWVPTLASAATAMLAYGSLVVTDFRGFKHFGVIGGYGMILCWLATYLFTPAILAASERIRPAYRPRRPGEAPPRARGYYGVLFAKLARGAPRAVVACGVLLGIGSAALSYRYLAGDPMEYNMKNIRNERGAASPAVELSGRVGDIVGRLAQDGMAIMTDRLDQVPMLEAKLKERHDAAPADLKPFERVVTIFSLLPKEQDEKIPLVEEMRRLIRKARSRGFIPDRDWAEIAPSLPEGEIKPIGIADLPEQTARPFTERDGTRGRIVYIVPKSGFSVWDAKYLMRWADSFRYTELPTGEVIKGSGRAVIYADMIQAVVEDVPKATAVAAAGAILIILIAFRGHWHALGVFLPWLLGVSLLLAFLQHRAIKLNFLNFMALPITIGIGAEYAHNLMQRYRAEGGRRLDRVITETGGAVVLCALTTAIGYVVLMRSINLGIVSFGLAAAVGELTCVLAAVMVLPAALVWMEQRRARRAGPGGALPGREPHDSRGPE